VCIPNGKISDFTTLTSGDLGEMQKKLGVGGRGNICFGHVLVAFRQGQRRDAAGGGARTRSQIFQFSMTTNSAESPVM
jgi:hypothetical protein